MRRSRYRGRESLLRAETGTIVKSGAPLRVCLIFPNTYNVAMSNLGFQTIYRELNSRPDTWCERGFLDPALGFESFESQTPFREFDVLAFSVSFELDLLGLATVLVESGLPLLAAERNGFHPLVVLGGVCATSNPEPVADFVDVVVIGEGENAVHDLADETLRHGTQNRDVLFRDLAAVPGFYVPSFEPAVPDGNGTAQSSETKRQRREGARRSREDAVAPAFSQIVTPNAEFANTFLVEVSRGCARSCRFCLARKLYPYRVWRCDTIQGIIEKFCPETAKVGLVGAAVSDHPEIDDIASWLVGKGKRLSIASLRVDSTSEALLRALAASGQRTVTFAPEAGTERLGTMIGKAIPQEVLMEKIELALAAGIKSIRLYFMVGLPSEQDEDIDGIVTLVKSVHNLTSNRARGHARLSVTISPFVPKPLTPLERTPMVRSDVLKRRISTIESGLSSYPEIDVRHDSLRLTALQGILSRGDRTLGRFIQLMTREKMSFKRASSAAEVDPDFYLYRERGPNESLPWEISRT